MAYKALGEVSKMMLGVKTNIDIKFRSLNSDTLLEFNIDEKNSIEVQQKLIKGTPGMVSMNANGTGIAFAAVSCDYIEITDEDAANFELRVGSRLSSNDKTITVEIETRAIDSADADVKGMSLVEVQLPSGFEFDKEENIYTKLSNIGVKVR